MARDEKDRVGLCAGCQHARRITSDRGAIFYQCALSASDPAFPKYPRLPVIACPGYGPAEGPSSHEGHEGGTKV